jgi:hypothetical protein
LTLSFFAVVGATSIKITLAENGTIDLRISGYFSSLASPSASGIRFTGDVWDNLNCIFTFLFVRFEVIGRIRSGYESLSELLTFFING